MRTLAFLAFAVVPLAAQNLTPDKALRVHFNVSAPFNRVPDVLRFNFGLTTVHSAYGTRRSTLYDCDRQLGTYASTLFGNYAGQLNLDPGASFKSPTSAWTFDNAGTADFTTIQNGTITGIIEFTIDAGAMTIPLNQVNLNMVQALSGNSGYVVTPSPSVLEAVIAPRLSPPSPGTAGVINTWQVTGATANSAVFLAIGTRCGPFPVLGMWWDIADPAIFIGIPTDPFGVANFAALVPPQLANRKLLLQGIDVGTGGGLSVTTLSAHTF